MIKQSNPAVYFEIPVKDMKRAVSFYNRVFNFQFEIDFFDSIEMAYFPFSENISGITGALAKGDTYIPTRNGVLIYLFTDNIEKTVKKALKEGAEIVYSVTLHESIGVSVAEIQDSEGNRIGLHQRTE